MTSTKLTEAQKVRRLHAAGAFVKFDMQLAPSVDGLWGLASAAANEPSSEQQRAAFERLNAYGLNTGWF